MPTGSLASKKVGNAHVSVQAPDTKNAALQFLADEGQIWDALDVDLIEQAISDVLSEGGSYRDAAEYVVRCVRGAS